MSEFKYTDKDDKLTEALISSEYDGEYWGKSEDLVLARAETYLLTRFGREALSEMTLLDLGCGMGRLIPRFAPLFGHVVGLEPDAERCAAAEKLVAEEHISNAEVHNCDCGAWLLENPDSRFDVVLCSHIFQHISHDTLGGILLDLQRCTHAQTAFVFTTTYVYGEENEYSTEFFEAGKRQTVIRTYDEFVDAIGHEGVLPVCRFAKPWLTHYLRGFGYETQDFARYHFYSEHDAERDAADNEDAAMQKNARDALYICTRLDASALGEDAAVAGKISFMHYYFLPNSKFDEKRFSQSAEDEHTAAVKADFDNAQGFLYSGGLHFKTVRRFVAELPLKLEGVPIRSAHAVLSYYPEANICQGSVCLNVDLTQPRNFVYLRTRCSARNPETAKADRLRSTGRAFP